MSKANAIGPRMLSLGYAKAAHMYTSGSPYKSYRAASGSPEGVTCTFW